MPSAMTDFGRSHKTSTASHNTRHTHAPCRTPEKTLCSRERPKELANFTAVAHLARLLGGGVNGPA
eukprot:5362967-Alexandrium_andersonii.AAC.1